jgi:hypothetical protein
MTMFLAFSSGCGIKETRMGMIENHTIIMRRRLQTAALTLFILTVGVFARAEDAPGLRDAVVMVIRHAEKPENENELSAEGVERAKAYVHYFYTLQADGRALKPDSLFATHDSKKSSRPRLTLEPLGNALNVPVDTTFKNKDAEGLARELESTPHGTNILVCLHHEKIPDFLQALGADPAVLLPEGKWPDNVYGWLIELHYDHQGRLEPAACKRVNEGLRPGDSP